MMTRARRVVDDIELAKDSSLLDALHGQFKKAEVTVERPRSQFPELLVTVPDDWNEIMLAPLYDVHIGNGNHDAALFARHIRWLANSPNVLTWNGGDMVEQATKLSVGAGVYEQDFSPQNQLVRALLQLSSIRHKMLFAIPGNHEDRQNLVGLDVGQWMAWILDIHYFSDYCFVVIRWRGNNFRILAHHGTGAAQTAGAQRMAARKDLAWARPFDLFWTGHLHSPLADILYQTDQDQSTHLMVERNGVVLISPSYLKYFGSYAAKKRLPPGIRGLAAVKLKKDGRIVVDIEAEGKRL
jgi:hypothetical protein